MKKLENVYYNLSHPGGLGCVKRLKEHCGVSEASAKEFLRQELSYTRHKQKFTKFRRRKVTAPTFNYLWQADLIFMQKYSKANKGFKYILTAIDVFSKRAFAIPVKNKTSGEIIRGFTVIFSNYKHKPVWLQCDEGKEFFNNSFKNYLEQFGIKLYHNFSDLKACVVERFNRTLLTRISKYFTLSKKNVYINVLDKIVNSYNSSVHSTTGFAPNKVNIFNEMDVWLHSNKELYNKPCKISKLKRYDRVRLCKKKHIFEKGYSASYTNEVFEVDEVINSIPRTFKIRDLSGNIISGIFYEQELQLVSDKLNLNSILK